MSARKPQDVGIVALDVYFPKQFVNQEALEKFDKAPAGKYTVGLGQTNMAYVGDREDIVSLCMTVTKSLMEKYNIKPTDIGRLEVGTETIIDKSKSVKTALMELFQESGNTSLEGIDNLNACYGGTSALFNSIQWIESSYWDGRYALVIAGDIAIYAEGNARPTGGCGAVAMLIGPNAPIVFDQGLRGVHMEHAYDFYKPNLDSEYPVVDGKLSVDCYLRSVDNCYNRYAEKYTLVHKGSKFDINAADYVVFHAPYNKLVQKSLARMVYNDMLRDSENPKYAPIVQFKELGLGEKSYANPTMEKAVAEFAKNVYQQKVVPGTILPKQVGNTYTASLYNGLVSLVSEIGDGLVGKRVFLFSYGSGLASTLFSFTVKTSIKHIVAKIDLKNKLASRQQVVPEQFVKTLQLRETRHGAKDYTPSDAIDTLFPGTYYLTKIDGKLRRFYARKPLLPSAL
jgi:hydroxymethylglutaryl-CoA synthase